MKGPCGGVGMKTPAVCGGDGPGMGIPGREEEMGVPECGAGLGVPV